MKSLRESRKWGWRWWGNGNFKDGGVSHNEGGIINRGVFPHTVGLIVTQKPCLKVSSFKLLRFNLTQVSEFKVKHLDYTTQGTLKG